MPIWLQIATIIAMVVLLSAREIGRAYGLSGSGRWARALNIIIAALVPLVTLVFVLRFLALLGHSLVH